MKKSLPRFAIVVAMLTAFAPGCSSGTEAEEEDSEDALTDASKEGQWVVDLAKVTQQYCGGTACTSPQFFGFDSSSMQGLPPNAGVVWDQAFAYDLNKQPIAKDKKYLAVKNGSALDGPTGKRINIIPLLKNTDPSKQKHIIEWLEDGDVLSYFHPEYLRADTLNERRASHVAMHYEVDVDGKTHVHHIDNPNNYGPRYNHPPSKQMPFHVFRYRPKGMAAETSKKFGLSARNWGLITDDISPFASFHDLRLTNVDDLDKKFFKPALLGQSIDQLYCSGLAYANLNVGVNYPLNAATLGADWSAFLSRSFARAESGGSVSGSDLVAAEELRAPKRALVFEPFTPSDMMTAWLDNTFQNLPVPVRKAIASQPQTHQSIAGGFSALRFSDQAEKGGSAATPTSGSSQVVATANNVKVWSEAYGLAPEATAAFVADATLRLDTPAGPKSLADLIRESGIDTAKLSPMQVLRALEVKYVKNQYTPPRIWLDEADRADSPMVYVGTVLHCELLSAADGSNADACADGDRGTSEFSEGAADTSTYPHYLVKNGGERTHRRFDSTPGPETMGKGTTVSVRATAADISDVLFLFHTPEMYAGQATELRSLEMMAYDGRCTELASEGKSCAPEQGIVLDPKAFAAQGTIEDRPFRFPILGEGGVCRIQDADTMLCPVAERSGQGWRTVGEKAVSRRGRGLVASTMIDLAAKTEPAASLANADRCTQCSTGGAHFNNWHVAIRNE